VKGRSVEEDLLSQLVVAKIDAARKGDTGAAKWLLKEFCGAVKQATDKNGKQHRGPSGPVCVVRHNVLMYFSECFQQILAGAPPSKALGVGHERSGRPSKKREDSLDRNVLLCAEVMALRNTTPKPTLKDTYRKVASKHNDVSARAVEKAWKDKSANIAAELIAKLKQGK
jgi:hypothetical protein